MTGAKDKGTEIVKSENKIEKASELWNNFKIYNTWTIGILKIKKNWGGKKSKLFQM
jgi:hypothetical protein